MRGIHTKMNSMETGSQEFIQMVVGDLEGHFAEDTNQNLRLNSIGNHSGQNSMLNSSQNRSMVFSGGPDVMLEGDEMENKDSEEEDDDDEEDEDEDDDDDDDDDDNGSGEEYTDSHDDSVLTNSHVVLGGDESRLIIPDNGMIVHGNQSLNSEQPGYIAMKPGASGHQVGLGDIVYGQNTMGHIILHEGVESEMIVEENIEVGDDYQNSNETSHGEIILVPNSMLKQEIIEGGEVIVGGSVPTQGNEIIIGDHLSGHGRHQDMSLTDMDDDGTFDSNLIIDTSAMKDEGLGTVGYDCGECGAILKSRGALRKHITKYHASTDPEPLDLPNKIYNCPSCPYQTARRDKLDKHIAKHIAEGFSPSGKKRSKATPPQRMRHAAEEYKCPLCPYRCTVEKAYRKHLKLHQAGSKHFVVKVSCKICGKDRSSEADLRKHMKKHKDSEDFVCDICGFASIQLKKIIQHRRMHTGEKPHLCPHCSYRSARRDNLRSHVRRMHKKENMYIDTFNPRSDINMEG